MSGPTPEAGGATTVTVPVPTPRPATGPASQDGLRGWLRAHLTDEWLIVAIAVILSIAAYRVYAAHGLAVAFNDARSREMIARRVLLSRTPGLAQLGTTWLPLPALLMLPLIWNDTLFRDGLAGAIPSMAAYVIAGRYLYQSARLVAASRWAGWVAAAALLLNPSVLYMQSTPMSEMPALAAFVASVYYALRLMRSYHALDVAKCAAAVATGTLIRYENWVLGLALLPVLMLAAWRRRGYALAEAWFMLYSLLAFAGCVAWVVYNAVIFHDPLLSFFYGQKSHTYYANTPAYLLPAHHHPVMALRMYGLTVVDTAGWVITIAAMLGLALFMLRNRLRLTHLPAYVTLVPFGFYWLVLDQGINTESLPGLGGPYYNVRFGLLMIPAIGLFSGYLVTAGRALTGAGHALVSRVLRPAALVAVITVSVVSGIQQPALVLREAVYGYGGDTRQTGQAVSAWLASHYHGGIILFTYTSEASAMFYLPAEYRVPDHAFITDSNGSQFTQALAAPQRRVTWIVMGDSADNGPDPLWTVLHRNTGWRRYFILRKSFPAGHSVVGYYGSIQLFERSSPNARASHPVRVGHARPAVSTVLRPLTASGLDETSLNARLAIDGSPATAWKTQWYVGDPAFGGLKPGAGLLLDMGHPVRLGTVLVTFGPTRGADVQIKIGDTAREPAMTTVAQASDVGGTYNFAAQGAATGRYVLIWFTRLPPMPGSHGNYRAEIFSVVLRSPGTP